MSQRGFTLIEVLVASAIFVGVMVIGVSSFSNINHINDRIQTTRNLSQTGNFVMEALSRDIRSATGFSDPSTGYGIQDYPFNFISNPTTGTFSDGQTPTQAIKTTTCINNPCTTLNLQRHTYVGDTSAQTLALVDSSGVSNPMLPQGIGLRAIAFNGVDHISPVTLQPYVTISFTLVDLASGAQQSFRTTVTSLVYPK